MIMRMNHSKYLSSLLKWPSAALLAAVGFVNIPSNKLKWTSDPGGSLSISQRGFSSQSSSQDQEEEDLMQVVNPSDAPWWKRMLGMGQQKDEILDRYVSETIRKNEKCTIVNKGCVRMFDTNWFAANKPIEDRHSEYLFKNNEYIFFGIFDGHSGWHCSETLRKRLPVYTALALLDTFTLDSYMSKDDFRLNSILEQLSLNEEGFKAVNLPKAFYEKQKEIGCGEMAFMESLASETKQLGVEKALTKAFVTLDDHLCSEAIPDGKVDESLLAGIAGSCAVVAVMGADCINVANAGDCRAVLGRRTSTGSWKAVQLTEDHSADNKKELNRLHDAHPNEKRHLVMNGRLLGQLQPLRAFGDVQYKWSKNLHERVLNVVYGRPVVSPAYYRSPPYLTAEPEITKHRIQSGDEFVILATDGLWEKVANDQAVKLIGEYVDTVQQSGDAKGNGASRLIRYALGKGSDTAVVKVLQIPDVYKRNFHDDITVTVVYLNGDNTRSKL